MIPRERLLNRLQGKPVDKVPNLSIVMQLAAQYANIPYGKYSSQADSLVEAQMTTARGLGLDILTVMSDPYRETSAYGAEILIQEDDLPLCKTTVLTDLSRWRQQLRPFTAEILAASRTQIGIDGVSFFKQKAGGDYAIAGWVEGAFAEFCDLSSVSWGMTAIVDDPAETAACLSFLTDQAIFFAQAQIEAGADIIGIGDSAASLVSARMYRNLIQPHEKRLIEAIHQAGGLVKLHICGDITHLLPEMIATGADIIDVDYMVDFDQAIALSKDRCSISGNIDPINLLLQGTPQTVTEQVDFCLTHGNDRSILSSGCEVPKNTPFENLKAIDDRLRQHAAA